MNHLVKFAPKTKTIVKMLPKKQLSNPIESKNLVSKFGYFFY